MPTRAEHIKADVERKRRLAERRRLAAEDGYRSLSAWEAAGRRARAYPLGHAPISPAELAETTRKATPRRRYVSPMIALLASGRYHLSKGGKIVHTKPRPASDEASE
jgi:hypothetical protein